MTRVVFDTSAIVKILASPARTIRLAKILQTHKIYTSDYILDEVTRVLVGKFGKTKPRAKTIARAYARVCTVINPTDAKHKLRDQTDSPIVSLCVQTNASVLVTNDKDLLGATIPGCMTLPFEDFWNSL